MVASSGGETMAAYLVLMQQVDDIDRYRNEYLPGLGPFLGKDGGEVLVAGSGAERPRVSRRTARREDAAAVVREAGGDVVLVDGEDLAERVTEVTDGAGVRLGIDAFAGTATGRLVGCLGEGAILVSYGRMSGEASVMSSDAFIFRDLTLRGFWLRAGFGMHLSSSAVRSSMRSPA
jgi:hypothetical protein